MTRLAGCVLAVAAFLLTAPGARAETRVARLTDDVVRVEASLRAHTRAGPVVGSTQALAGESRFLTHVGDEKLARRVLAHAMQDRALSQNAPLIVLFQLGERHPEIAFEYLRAHAATLLWPAAEPPETERFLRDALPGDGEAVQNAVATIRRRWDERRALRAALRSLQPAAASACPAAGSC